MSPRGDGSVYPITLPSGAIRFKASLVIDGKRVERTGKTRTEALGLLRQMRRARDLGQRDIGRPWTFEKWLWHWLDNIAPENGRCGEDTLARYRGVIKNHIVPEVGNIRLPNLTPEHIRRVHQAQRAKGLAGGSVYKSHAIMRRALRVAQREGRVERNVAQLVDGPSAAHDEIVPLSRAEARKILRLAEQEPGGVRWTLALALGLRQGEVLGLQRRMLDLDQRLLTVGWQLKRHKPRHGCAESERAKDADGRWPCGEKFPSKCSKRIGESGLYLKHPKSAKSRRTLVLPEQVATALRAHLAEQSRERLRAGSRWVGFQTDGETVELVFCQPNGRPIEFTRDYKNWLALLERADVPEARLHDARHTAATILLEMGVNVKIVSEMLGHATTSFTQQRYQHLVPELVEDAANRMSDALWGEEDASRKVAPARSNRRRRGKQ